MRIFLGLVALASSIQFNTASARTEPGVPHGKLTISFKEISYKESVEVTYSITSWGDGYYYISLIPGSHFEATNGDDHWTGYLKQGKSKSLTFSVKLTESVLNDLDSLVPLSVGYT